MDSGHSHWSGSLGVLVDELSHAVDPAAPQLLVLVEQPSRPRSPSTLVRTILRRPVRCLVTRPARSRIDVLLHSCEAHRIWLAQLGDALSESIARRTMSWRVWSACAEHAIEIGGGSSYTTIRLYGDPVKR